MPGNHSVEDAMTILDSHLKSRGASCMAGLARAFEIVDVDKNMKLTRDECKAGLLTHGGARGPSGPLGLAFYPVPFEIA